MLDVALGCLLLGWLGGKYLATWMSVFNVLAYVPLIWCIVRMYSRNFAARRRENAAYMRFWTRLKDRQNRYFRCPRCNQTVRVPRGKGRSSCLLYTSLLGEIHAENPDAYTIVLCHRNDQLAPLYGVIPEFLKMTN